jgi:preprotein translocase subunit YajC
MYIAATSSGKGSSSATFLILIVVIIGVFYFLMIRPQRNRQRQAMQTQNTVTPGARVRTTAGMYATVVSVDGDDVILEVAPGVEVRYMRRAVMEVISDNGAYDETTEEQEDAVPDDAVPEDAMAEPGIAGEDVTAERVHPAADDAPEPTGTESHGPESSGTVHPEGSPAQDGRPGNLRSAQDDPAGTRPI